jgi:hypothetical protein
MPSRSLRESFDKERRLYAFVSTEGILELSRVTTFLPPLFLFFSLPLSLFLLKFSIQESRLVSLSHDSQPLLLLVSKLHVFLILVFATVCLLTYCISRSPRSNSLSYS